MENKYNNTSVLELTVKDFNGKKVINPAFKNSFGLIKIYAPWCPHCTVMVETLVKISDALKSEGFSIGAINSENPLNKDLVRQIGCSGFPSLYMVNTDGELEYTEIMDKSTETILGMICDKTSQYAKKGDNKIVSRTLPITKISYLGGAFSNFFSPMMPKKSPKNKSNSRSKSPSKSPRYLTNKSNSRSKSPNKSVSQTKGKKPVCCTVTDGKISC